MSPKNNFIPFVIVVSCASIAVLSGCTSEPSNTDPTNWIDSYVPTHDVGNGSDNFWIDFPAGNPSSGQEVDHLDWIEAALRQRPLLFVVHRTGCTGCAAQAERVIEFGEQFGSSVVFYDLDAVASAPPDIVQKANEVYYYDPNGSPGYIALTGVYTLVNDGGEVKVAWHTWEAPDDMTVSDADLETWIKDAVYYFHMNGD